MKNIVLLGFMGTGKTAVAKAVAEKTGMEYVSTDELIEKREGAPINDIFAKKGEPHFREVEKSVIKEVSQRPGMVIDAGGGAVLDAGNIKNLKKNGVLVCLWASPEIIYKRVREHGHRPLLNVQDPMRKIQELLDHRKPFYERADYHIETSSLGIDEVRDVVIKYHKEDI